MPQLNTRSAAPEDISRLYELYAEQRDIQDELDPRLQVTRFQDDYTAEVWIAAKRILFRDGRLDDNHLLLVAEDDDRIMGYIDGWWEGEDDNRSGRVQDVVVDAHFGQGGVGTALLQGAMDWFRGHDVQHVIVDAVPRNHAVQQAFWRAKGASVLQETFYLSLSEGE